jgi:hypothetical protein
VGRNDFTWKKGVSGNPHGRPLGSVNTAWPKIRDLMMHTLVLHKEEIEATLAKAIQKPSLCLQLLELAARANREVGGSGVVLSEQTGPQLIGVNLHLEMAESPRPAILPAVQVHLDGAKERRL